MKFVRLKPYNGRTHVKRTHTVFGIKFQEANGWYKVDDDVAEYLTTVKMFDHGPDAEFSADAFDVVDTLDAAKQIDAKEKAKDRRNVAELAERKVRVHTPTRTAAPRSAPKQEAPLSKSFDDENPEFDEDMAPAPTSPATAEVGGDDAEEEEATEETDAEGVTRAVPRKKKRSSHR